MVRNMFSYATTPNRPHLRFKLPRFANHLPFLSLVAKSLHHDNSFSTHYLSWSKQKVHSSPGHNISLVGASSIAKKSNRSETNRNNNGNDS
jgi:hypothetical protein